jgi:hypothetical protein
MRRTTTSLLNISFIKKSKVLFNWIKFLIAVFVSLILGIVLFFGLQIIISFSILIILTTYNLLTKNNTRFICWANGIFLSVDLIFLLDLKDHLLKTPYLKLGVTLVTGFIGLIMILVCVYPRYFQISASIKEKLTIFYLYSTVFSFIIQIRNLLVFFLFNFLLHNKPWLNYYFEKLFNWGLI